MLSHSSLRLFASRLVDLAPRRILQHDMFRSHIRNGVNPFHSFFRDVLYWWSTSLSAPRVSLWTRVRAKTGFESDLVDCRSDHNYSSAHSTLLSIRPDAYGDRSREFPLFPSGNSQPTRRVSCRRICLRRERFGFMNCGWHRQFAKLITNHQTCNLVPDPFIPTSRCCAFKVFHRHEQDLYPRSEICKSQLTITVKVSSAKLLLWAGTVQDQSTIR